jgi:hypothetical protein
LFRQLETIVLRSDKRWRSGAEDERLKRELELDLAFIKEQFDKSMTVVKPRPASLAELADAKSAAAISELRQAVSTYLSKTFEPGVKIGEADKAKVEELKKIEEDLVGKLKKLPEYRIGAAVFVDAALRSPNLTPGRVITLNKLLGQIRPSATSEERFTETVFLERLEHFYYKVVKENEWTWPTAQAYQSLKVMARAEDLLATLGANPELLFPWNKTLWDQGEDQRRKGEKDLFAGAEFTWRDAGSALVQAEQYLKQIDPRVNVLKDMLEERDRAYLHLPGWAPYLIALGRPASQDNASWRDAAQSAQLMVDLLEKKEFDTLANEPNSFLQLHRQVEAWNGAMKPRITRLLRISDEGNAGDYREMQALLESPRLSADQRLEIWRTARKLGLKLHEAVVNLDDADYRGRSGPSTSLGEDQTAKEEQERRVRRVRTGIALLRLTPIEAKEIEPLETRAEAAIKTNEASDWRRVSKELGDLWSVKLPDRYRMWVKIDLAKADRVSRIVPGLEVERTGAGESQATFRNPTFALYRTQLGEFWKAQHERYSKEKVLVQAQGAPAEITSFYADKADEYLRRNP